MARAHILGAGLSGLSAAVELAAAGLDITLYEAAGEAGGRCRTFHDAALDCIIDNGNHLLLSGNYGAMAFLDRIGTTDELSGPPEARFNFVDIGTNERWCVRPNKGRLPWWIFAPSRRVAGTKVTDYLAASKILNAGPDDVFTSIISPDGALYERFWEPIVVGALNIDPYEAAAILLKPVLLETFAKGADACRPLIAKTGLGETFVAPALKYLSEKGADIRFGARVKGFETDNGRIAKLDGVGEAVGTGDVVICAVPWWNAERLLPDYAGPTGVEPILNAHFRLKEPFKGYEDDPVVGVIGGLAQWLFIRGDVVSVTVSAAGRHTREANEATVEKIWDDVRKALNLGDEPLPRWRIIKEHRATFRQTPEQIKLRPGAITAIGNLFLAGDWTDTKLPATIEGSIRSGKTAAGLALEKFDIA
ncbi:MAG: hydroxysqualene dehydroxylase HpnE [Hyphomicrobiales bacterium]